MALPRPDNQQNYAQPLTPRVQKVVEYVCQGMSWRAASQQVGLACREQEWKKDPRVQAALAVEREKNAKLAELKRQDVIDGLKEAVALAKLVSDPHALIKAWAELGKLCGFYAPEIKKLDISVTSRRVITQMEGLSERELLELANEELSGNFAEHFRRLPAPVIEGEVLDAEIIPEES
jgi:hypothetical protein